MQAQRPAAEAHGAGTDEHNLAAFVEQFRDSVNDGNYALFAELAIRLRDGACAEFDNNTACGAQAFAALFFSAGFGGHMARCAHLLELLGYANLPLRAYSATRANKIA